MNARDEVLDRIRSAIAATAVDDRPVPRTYRRHGEHGVGSPELIDQLTDRLVDYKATVIRCGPGEEQIGVAVAEALSARSAARVVAPSGLPTAWLPERVADDDLTPVELDALDGVVTGCALAIAETGTIVLDGAPECGRRAITLVPDLHVCIVRTDQVVQTVPEGVALLDPLRPLTFISGPSATSDIELNRVEGVHGPRTLVVVLAGEA